MPKHRYLNNVLFDNDDDETEVYDRNSSNAFRQRIPLPQTKTVNCTSNHSPEMYQQNDLMKKRQEIEQQTLQSSSSSIALLEDAEDAGICAAKKLAQQGEHLQNTNKMLDVLDGNLKKSKRHIKGIKSVYHEIKSYISAHSPPPLRRKLSPKLHDSNSSSSTTFYSKVDNSSCTKDSYDSQTSTYLSDSNIENSGKSPTSQQVDNILEANCNTMRHHLARLKGIGTELGNEIDQQNNLIDTIQNKLELEGTEIEIQNKQIDKIKKQENGK